MSTKTKTRVWVQPWEESEAGWGVRPDGYSLHLTREDVDKFITAYWKSQPDQVPNEYSRPSGPPFQAEYDGVINQSQWAPPGWRPKKP